MNCASGNSTANRHSGEAHPNEPVGRFAPSPSGPLHFGSLLSAVASFLDARSQHGRWLLRIDNLDTTRTTPGSEDAILRTLEAHHLLWDDRPTRQTDNLTHYHRALQQLVTDNALFFCNCSRKSLQGATIYPGHCRANTCTLNALATHLALPSDAHTHAIRLRAPDLDIVLQDELQGAQPTNLMRDGGDYIVMRRDGLISYQLAVVVDDALTGVNRVVRGADLLPTTARQQHLHGLLGSTPPAWLHLPILLDARHSKLSKHVHSLAIANDQAGANLNIALQLLGQQPPDDAQRWPVATLIAWAIENWQPARLPAVESLEHFFGW